MQAYRYRYRSSMLPVPIQSTSPRPAVENPEIRSLSAAHAPSGRPILPTRLQPARKAVNAPQAYARNFSASAAAPRPLRASKWLGKLGEIFRRREALTSSLRDNGRSRRVACASYNELRAARPRRAAARVAEYWQTWPGDTRF